MSNLYGSKTNKIIARCDNSPYISFVQFIQCYPLYKPVALQRLITRVNGGEILLDLEDSIMDPITAENTFLLKANARNCLLGLADWLEMLGKKQPLHIRINHSRTRYYKQDLETLSQLKRVRWESVFLPKAESNDDILRLNADLKSAEINYACISPIVETRKGINWLQNSFGGSAVRLYAIFFGNYDYNLDCCRWPLVEQTNEEYWTLIRGLIDKVESNGYSFGNSPYAHLDDLFSFNQILSRLDALCKRRFYQITLCATQSNMCMQLINGEAPARKINWDKPLSTHGTSALYFKHKLRNRSFAFDRSQGKLITPHEYLLSINQRT